MAETERRRPGVWAASIEHAGGLSFREKKRGFSAHLGPGGVVLPPRVLSLKKINVLDAVGYIPQAAGKAVGGMGRA